MTPAVGTASPPRQDSDHARLEVFVRHRSLLFSVAYRMLGRRADAEDIVQETFLRWEHAADQDIRDPRAFLVTVVTRLCINQLQSARAQREQYFGQWLPEPVLTGADDAGDALFRIDGSLSLAFLLLLERLTATERAVLLLREVFDYDYAEIAGMLDQTEANCRQLLRRARQHLKEDRRRFDVTPEHRETLLRRFLETTASGDMQGLVALLSDEVVLYADGGGKATAVPNPVYGVDRVARFLVRGRAKLVPRDVVRRLAGINGQPGVVLYHEARPFGVLTLDVGEGRIRGIYIVRNPDKLGAFCLPAGERTEP